MSDPFAAPGQWFKGSLHTHTTESDGAISPADNIRWHTEHGYDFVALTDHDRVTDPRRFCDPQIVTILGTELSLGVNGGGGPFHLVACGLPPDFQPPKANSLTAQQGIEIDAQVFLSETQEEIRIDNFHHVDASLEEERRRLISEAKLAEAVHERFRADLKDDLAGDGYKKYVREE